MHAVPKRVSISRPISTRNMLQVVCMHGACPNMLVAFWFSLTVSVRDFFLFTVSSYAAIIYSLVGLDCGCSFVVRVRIVVCKLLGSG